MHRKNLNYKPLFFKVFFFYIVVYFSALIFRYSYDWEPFLNNIQSNYLIVSNIICVFLGIPLTTIFDFLLIKLFGIYYVLFFFPVLTILSVIQVLILRKLKLKFSRNIFFLKDPEKNNLYKFFEHITFRSFYILILRSFPILPHALGSYIIASSKIENKVIVLNTFIGSFFYYIFLFLIVGNI